MPAISTIIAVGALLVGAAGTAYSITEQKKAAEEEREQREEQADLEKERGRREAAAIRKKGELLLGEQAAAFGASGAMLAGTPEALLAHTDTLSEMDALQALRDADNRARFLIDEGEQATRAADSYAVGASLSFAGKAAGTGYDLFSAKASSAPGNVPLWGDEVVKKTKSYSFADTTKINDNFNLI